MRKRGLNFYAFFFVCLIFLFFLSFQLASAASPVVASLIVNSTSLYNFSTGDLGVYVNATDSDGGLISYDGQWYKNGGYFIRELWNASNGGMTPGRYNDYGNDIIADSQGNIYVAGYSNDSSTYWISQFDGEIWDKKYSESFAVNYETKPFEFEAIDGKVVLRIVQKHSAFGDIDAAILNACGKEIVPEYAKFVDSGKDILEDVLKVDNNVIVAHENEIEVSWEMPESCAEAVLNLNANEYGEASPLEFGGSYIFGEDSLFAPYWVTSTGHPSGYAYIDVSDDSENVYFSIDVTPDNTEEFGEDWTEILIGEKKFRVDDFTNVYGSCGFGYTNRADYKHQACEFVIPKIEVERYAENGKIDFGLKYYGTAGGANPYRGFVAKYTNNGTMVWNASYIRDELNVNSFYYGITVDSSDNVYACGYLTNATNYYGLVIKYNSSGSSILNITSSIYYVNNLYYYGIAVDSDGNMYAAADLGGFGFGDDSNFTLIKYNSTGAMEWNVTMDYDALDDTAYDVVVNGSDIYVTGIVEDSVNDMTSYTARYNSSGSQIWNMSYQDSVGSYAYAYDIALDSFGNVYTAGDALVGSQRDSFVASYSSGGDSRWNATYDWAGSTDWADGLFVDYLNNVYVTVSSRNNSDSRINILKYNYTGGELIGNITSNYPGFNLTAYGLAGDLSGSVYAVGQIFTGNYSNDILIKYNTGFLGINKTESVLSNLSAIDSSFISAGENWTACARAFDGTDYSSFECRNISVLTADESAPVVSIISPTATTYTTAIVSVNIGLNEPGICIYSLNSGLTNNTLTANRSNSGFTGTTASLSNGNYILNAYCNDSFENRNNTINSSFTINVATASGDIVGGGGSGFACTPSWQCINWDSCVSGKQIRACTDKSNCGTVSGKPAESQNCVLQGEITNETQEEEKEEEQEGCISEFECGEWSECQSLPLTADEIFKGDFVFEGRKTRICEDTSECGKGRVEVGKCSISVNVEIEKDEEQDAVVLRDSVTKKKVSAIDLSSWRENGKFRVVFVEEDIIYPLLCYNGIKDGSEIGIDCGGSECKLCYERKIVYRILWPWWILLILAVILVYFLVKLKEFYCIHQIKKLLVEGKIALEKRDSHKSKEVYSKIRNYYGKLTVEQSKQIQPFVLEFYKRVSKMR